MPQKYKRCVEKVSKDPSVDNPHAVCTAANAGGIKQVRKREAAARKPRKAKRRKSIQRSGVR